MKAHLAFAAVLIACSGCAHIVRDPAEAIAIADKACARSHVDPSKWYAQLVGDYWDVSALLFSGGGHSNSVSVRVPRKGSSTDSIQCTHMFTD